MKSGQRLTIQNPDMSGFQIPTVFRSQRASVTKETAEKWELLTVFGNSKKGFASKSAN